jgi:hypothetical protein
MREHQIIINLKPEHYQELERLSRVAGSRSVSIFVKERILASLGIVNSTSSANISAGSNLPAVTADIRRLHRDLQVFVAESLSGKDFGYVSGDPADLVAQSAIGVVPAANSATVNSGALIPTTPIPITTIALPSPSPVQLQSASQIESQYPELSQFPPTTSEAVPAAPSNQAVPRRQGSDFPLTPQGSFRPGGVFSQPATGVPINASSASPSSQTPTPILIPTPTPTPTSTPSPSSSSPLIEKALPVRDPSVPDDLEELAERAFAISPRLGAMDEIDDDVPMFSDPLDELLGEIDRELEDVIDEHPLSEVSEVPIISTVVPRTHARRAIADGANDESRKAAAQDSAAAPESAHETSEMSSAESFDDDDDDDDDDYEEEDHRGEDQPHTTVADHGVHDDKPSDETDEAVAESRDDPDAEEKSPPADINSGSSQNPPPISGGPPPRRRRT